MLASTVIYDITYKIIYDITYNIINNITYNITYNIYIYFFLSFPQIVSMVIEQS